MWLVCKNKKDSELFLQTREEREAMLSVLMDLKQLIPSVVLKSFEEKKLAEKYVVDMNDANSIIKNILE